MPIQLKIRVDEERTTQAFKDARRDINRRMGHALKTAGERVVLPPAKAAIYSFARPYLIIRGRTRSAVLTSTQRGKLGRALGLLEFGGTVRTPIYPKSRKALTVGPGVVRANVKGPRTYKGQRRLEKVVLANLPRTTEAIRDEIVRVAFAGMD